MGEEDLAAAIAIQAKLLHQLLFNRIGDGCSIKVSTLCCCRTQSSLALFRIKEPLIGKYFPAIHAANWDDHLLPG